jgi:2-oxoisovalerate dehydrogenase E1 component
MISHLGPQLGVCRRIALANKLKKNGKITAVFTGEGATSEGDFHEALNIAAVWELVLFVIENNGYGLRPLQMNNIVAKTLLIRVKDMVWKVYWME